VATTEAHKGGNTPSHGVKGTGNMKQHSTAARTQSTSNIHDIRPAKPGPDDYVATHLTFRSLDALLELSGLAVRYYLWLTKQPGIHSGGHHGSFRRHAEKWGTSISHSKLAAAARELEAAGLIRMEPWKGRLTSFVIISPATSERPGPNGSHYRDPMGPSPCTSAECPSADPTTTNVSGDKSTSLPPESVPVVVEVPDKESAEGEILSEAREVVGARLAPPVVITLLRQLGVEVIRRQLRYWPHREQVGMRDPVAVFVYCCRMDQAPPASMPPGPQEVAAQRELERQRDLERAAATEARKLASLREWYAERGQELPAGIEP